MEFFWRGLRNFRGGGGGGMLRILGGVEHFSVKIKISGEDELF